VNYPSPVSRLRVITHNRTKYRKNGTCEQNYFLSIMPIQVPTHLSDLGWRPDPPSGPGGLPSTFLSINGRRSQISDNASQGGRIDVFYVDSGRSQISISTSQGPHRRCFLALMVDTLGPMSQPPRGASSSFLSVDGGRSRTSDTASQGPANDVSKR
jgi:hypothetical protein